MEETEAGGKKDLSPHMCIPWIEGRENSRRSQEYIYAYSVSVCDVHAQKEGEEMGSWDFFLGGEEI